MKKQTVQEKLAQLQALDKGKKTPMEHENELLKGEIATLKSKVRDLEMKLQDRDTQLKTRL